MGSQKLTLTPQQKKQLLFGFVGAIGLLAWMIFLVAPQQQARARGAREIQDLKSRLGRVRQGLAQLPSIEQQLEQMKAQSDLPDAFQPPEEQLPDLMAFISQSARRGDVRLMTVKPEEELRKLSPGLSGYLELPIRLEVSAGYHQIGTFLDLLENSERLLRISEFRIEPASENPLKHKGKFLLQAYLLPGMPSAGSASP